MALAFVLRSFFVGSDVNTKSLSNKLCIVALMSKTHLGMVWELSDVES